MSRKHSTYSEPRRELYTAREAKRFERTAERRQARTLKAYERGSGL